MNIVRNDAVVRRNSRIAQVSMIAGLLVLAGGMYLSFARPQEVSLSLSALVLGFILSQIGIYYTNRWGRSPRPDELINQALKGLDSKYTIYHYATPGSHLLVGPSGIWVLMPRHQRGTISYSKGRWRQKGGNLYLKIFAQESLGRPELEVKSEIESVEKYLSRMLPEEVGVPEVQAALVFTNPKTVINLPEDENPPAETVPLSKLKDVVRKTAKTKPLSMDKVRLIQEALPD